MDKVKQHKGVSWTHRGAPDEPKECNCSTCICKFCMERYEGCSNCAKVNKLILDTNGRIKCPQFHSRCIDRVPSDVPVEIEVQYACSKCICKDCDNRQTNCMHCLRCLTMGGIQYPTPLQRHTCRDFREVRDDDLQPVPSPFARGSGEMVEI